MPSGHITKRTVDAAQTTSNDTYIWDEELAGFGLKVTPGGRKVYLVQYRIGGRKGRTRRVTIGQHGTLTPNAARIQAKRLLGRVAAGHDPADERNQVKKELTIGVALDRFMVEHVANKLKPSTVEEYRRLARLYIGYELRSRSVSALTRSEIGFWHHGLRGKPYQANRGLALLSKFFNWAEKHGLRTDGSNPCRHIARFPERKRDRFLSNSELARLGAALTTAERENTCSPWTIAAIRLLALTGARRNEILNLRWEHVSFEHGTLTIPNSKTGRKVIHLNSSARRVIERIPRVDGNPFVICGAKEGKPVVNIERPWRRIRAAATLDNVRLHDLRHSFASVAALGGMSLHMIGTLLGHSQPATTARYAHFAADPLKSANDAVGERIASALADESVNSAAISRDEVEHDESEISAG